MSIAPHSIIVTNVTKTFTRQKRTGTRLIHTIAHHMHGTKQPTSRVLDAITFSARTGETIGLIGDNGAGKSTLLRCIAGIYASDTGVITTHGDTMYLSGFTHGLQYDLTMRENILLIGVLMGLTKQAVLERFDAIVELSELRAHLDTVVGTFSTGMLSRLSFAIGVSCLTHTKPDILLLDEIGLGGGGADMAFRERSRTYIETLLQSGATVLLASHDLATIETQCTRALWIEHGTLRMDGNPHDVCTAYKAHTLRTTRAPERDRHR